jgi:hypothetical protein
LRCDATGSLCRTVSRPNETHKWSAVRQPRVRGSGSPHVVRGAGPGSGHDGLSSGQTIMAVPAIAGPRGTRATSRGTRSPSTGHPRPIKDTALLWGRLRHVGWRFRPRVSRLGPGSWMQPEYGCPGGIAHPVRGRVPGLRQKAPTFGLLVGAKVPGGFGESRRVCHGKPLHPVPTANYCPANTLHH